MTRKKFDKLTRALSFTMTTFHGGKQDGKMLRNLNQKDYSAIIKTHGSYKACWEWMKPVREAYGMK